MKSRVSRLLVVDDEESVALTLSAVLRREGYAVDVALSGEAAIQQLHRQTYDLVLTDLNMENVDGLSVLSELRKKQPLTTAIVLTGFASLESAVASMRHGAHDYLIKPCLIEDLKLTISRGLEHRRLLLAEKEAREKLEQMNTDLERLVQEQTEHLRKANLELQQQDAAKDIFLATVSHELRTPLTPIIGWARLLSKNPSSPSLLQGLQAIERNALLQSEIVEDLLDVSRIVSGKLLVQQVQVNLNSVVVAAADTLQGPAGEKNIKLEFDLPQMPVWAMGDESRLHQVICNLISNAVKFTGPGGTAKIALHESDGEARIVVSDTGIGISPEFLPHVFDRFKQGEWFHTRKHEGLGLGLSIVRTLVEMHSGSVTAESPGLGRGSTFIIKIPSICCEQLAAMQAQEGLHPSGLESQPPILVVDDSVDTLEIIQLTLEQRGWPVLTASNVREAVELLKNDRPGLVITDVGMPEPGGLMLKTYLEELGQAAIPLVAISGYARSEDIDRVRALGFADYLVKPLDLNHLVRVVERLNAGYGSAAVSR